LGKTKVTIDDNTRLHYEGEINACLLISPNGIHTNWVKKEIPTHSRAKHISFLYRSGMGKKLKQSLNHFMNQKTDDLKYLCMNIEALRTKEGLYTAEYFLKKHRCSMVIDESSIIKSPKAQVSKITVKLGQLAKYRRILTGTPITQGPLDAWMQFKFLHPKILPFLNYTAFKSCFAIIVQKTFGARSFQSIEGYQNIPRLTEYIKPFSFRCLKKDCLDLPEKTYSSRYVELTKEQRKAYNELKSMAVTLLDSDVVTSTTPLSLLSKLLHISSGFVKGDAGHITRLPTNKPKALMDLWNECGQEKMVIFVKYKDNVRRLEELAKENDIGYVTYSGLNSNPDDRQAAVDRFQEDPSCKWFVATSAAARGLTLTAARYCVYYANDYSLETRLQSEDRIHRIGQGETCVYIDMLAEDTVEEAVIKALQGKQDLATEVLSNLIKIISE